MEQLIEAQHEIQEELEENKVKKQSKLELEKKEFDELDAEIDRKIRKLKERKI